MKKGMNGKGIPGKVFWGLILLVGLALAGCGDGTLDGETSQGLGYESSQASVGPTFDTAITKGPTTTGSDRTAIFQFSCGVGPCTYQCKLDQKAWQSCVSLKTYKKLLGGAHHFQVKATQTRTGKVDKTPATYDWTIVDVWIPTSTVNAPAARYLQTAVWTGSRMIVFGGEKPGAQLKSGGRYNPAKNTWAPTETARAPEARSGHSAVWTGNEMIIWGGHGLDNLNTGARYDPTTDSWHATSTDNAPSPRYDHTAIWDTTNLRMIVWGGFDGITALNTGGRYDPVSNSWTSTQTTNAPTGRSNHSAVWEGVYMIVWGGYGGGNQNTGGKYYPDNDSWSVTSTVNAPSARQYHTAVCDTTNYLMYVWGGYDSVTWFNTGGKYNVSSNSWTALPTANAPAGRKDHTAVWTGAKMIVWGGRDSGGAPFNSGAVYDPTGNSWAPTSLTNAPTARYGHTAVWADDKMVIWGGVGSSGLNKTGAIYWP